MRGSSTLNHAARPGSAWPLLLPLAGLLAGGCGSLTSSGYSVSGTVTWNGQPLDQGSIQFLPEGGQGEMVGAGISGGRYTCRTRPAWPRGPTGCASTPGAA